MISFQKKQNLWFENIQMKQFEKIMNKNVQKYGNIVRFYIIKFKKKRENGIRVITKLEINSPIIL